jgi:hypothetical protein
MTKRLAAMLMLPIAVMGCEGGSVTAAEVTAVQVSELGDYTVEFRIAGPAYFGRAATLEFAVTRNFGEPDADEDYAEGQLGMNPRPVAGLDPELYCLDPDGAEEIHTQLDFVGASYVVEHTFGSTGYAYAGFRIPGVQGEAGFLIVVEPRIKLATATVP